MAKQIVLSGRGKSSLQQMVGYIQVEFSDEAASALIERFIDKANWVAKYPESGQTTPFKTVRSIKIDRNRRFYYRVQGKNLIVLLFWDSRQDPDKNPYKK